MASCKTLPTPEQQIEVMQALVDGRRVMQRVRPDHKATVTKSDELFNWWTNHYWISDGDQATPEWAESVGMKRLSRFRELYIASNGDSFFQVYLESGWTKQEIRNVADIFGIELNE